MKWLNKLLKKDFHTIQDIINDFKRSSDFVHYQNDAAEVPYTIAYFSSLVDSEKINRDILPYLPKRGEEDLRKMIPIQEIIKVEKPEDIQRKLPEGYLFLYLNSDKEDAVLIQIQKTEKRNISAPEVEFSVVGPKEAFVESMDTNIHLVRKRLPIQELKVEEVIVGRLSKTKVAILYIDGIAEEENINTMKQRIEDIDFDFISDSSYIAEIITDNEYSPFPLVLDTERPDRVAAVLAEGKIAVLVEDSPHALIAPTTFVEFFSSFEDYLFNWYVASFIRLVRVFAVTFSILITPIYVAALTYHYELIPKDLLATLITSRREIPLPPILEALFLELTIELLREAGARLPTKVGQTIGIVGGIVIGTASVEAGLTSNVLLIIVALSALASFTTPVYKMGNTIRLIRFPFLLLAHLWGLIGIVLCFCFLITHMIHLTSLGRPFLEPIYPLRVKDLKDAFIRLPFSKQASRPVLMRSDSKMRFSSKDANVKRDIDE
ncbi:spore germination protein [Bacillus salitolerans]|uniref:Spore germination protein n=1 Tax=Bacillus salitolerans TaxID=1437434 RepID=A0ABW4LV15_9BACI